MKYVSFAIKAIKASFIISVFLSTKTWGQTKQGHFRQNLYFSLSLQLYSPAFVLERTCVAPFGLLNRFSVNRVTINRVNPHTHI